jgi:hypothetical protein
VVFACAWHAAVLAVSDAKGEPGSIPGPQSFLADVAARLDAPPALLASLTGPWPDADVATARLIADYGDRAERALRRAVRDRLEALWGIEHALDRAASATRPARERPHPALAEQRVRFRFGMSHGEPSLRLSARTNGAPRLVLSRRGLSASTRIGVGGHQLFVGYVPARDQLDLGVRILLGSGERPAQFSRSAPAVLRTKEKEKR